MTAAEQDATVNLVDDPVTGEKVSKKYDKKIFFNPNV